MWEFLQAYSGAVVGIFTIVLVGVTVVYVFVTYRLLKQSKNAFLADIILRVMGVLQRETRGLKEEEVKGVTVFVTAWMESYRKTFMEIDKRLGTDIEKLYEVCIDNLGKTWAMMEKKLEEEKKEKEKLEKEIKGNKGSGTS